MLCAPQPADDVALPELPEVETTRRGIEPHMVGRQVKTALVREHRLRWPVDPALSQRVSGLTVDQVTRRGKYLLVCTAEGRLMIHLGMSGSLRVLPQHVTAEKHDHIDLILDDDHMLRYRDPRRFGSFFWLPGNESHSLLDSLGPEPLSPEFDSEYLFQRAKKRTAPIKQFIMDSKVVVGVGNIYANESLFLSGIHPERKAGSVSKQRLEKLVVNIKRVLAAAIDAGGTTLRDFVKEDGNPGYFKQELKVYGRGGELCSTCGQSLKEIRLGQRTTVFCRRCQT